MRKPPNLTTFRRLSRQRASSVICLPIPAGIRRPSTITASFPARASMPHSTAPPAIGTGFMPERLEIATVVIAPITNRPETRTMRPPDFRRPASFATNPPTAIGTRPTLATPVSSLCRACMQLWTAAPAIRTMSTRGPHESAMGVTGQTMSRPETRITRLPAFPQPVKPVTVPQIHPGARLDSPTPGFPSLRAGMPGMTVPLATQIKAISRCSPA